MAVALPPTPRSVQFPHNILHESPSNHRATLKMEVTHLTKPSLPSISSLIEAVKDHQAQSGMGTSPTNADHQRKHSGASSGHATSPDRSTMMNGSPRSHPPPTPPLPPTSSFDFFPRNSPGNTSPISTTSQGAYYGHAPSTTNNNTDGYSHLRSSYPPIPEPGQWSSQQQSPKQQQSRQQPPHPPRSPTEASYDSDTRHNSTSSYPEPPTPESYTGLSQQRPLPTTFPPISSQSQTLPPIDPQVAPSASPIQVPSAAAWQQQQQPQPQPQPQQQQQQHHHYYPPTTNPANYSHPPAADRYVCPTCSKPFSRPSSLKIHTYSHTGEKPFKCKHDGCGKFFSVRSNMKRHEKGCHGGEGSSAGGNSPQP